MQSIIEVKSLKKSFDELVVVDDVSFLVKKGTLFAFLGQNGAGKSTTINMIVGLLKHDSGEILYKGSTDYAQFKNKIGIVFQNNILDDLLTVEENLFTHGSLYIKNNKELKNRCKELLKLLSLEDVVKKRFKTLSGGQKRKVEIARALFATPEILFLDEPTTGLDPKTRSEVWEIVNKLKNEKGMTIFLTTHYMEETAFADYIAIIDKGKIIATGSPVELKSKYTFDRLLITPNVAQEFELGLKELKLEAKKTADTYMIKIDNVLESIKILNYLKENIRFYEVIKGSMDDVFLNVVGKKARQD